jgi:hypothetical protein
MWKIEKKRCHLVLFIQLSYQNSQNYKLQDNAPEGENYPQASLRQNKKGDQVKA